MVQTAVQVVTRELCEEQPYDTGTAVRRVLCMRSMLSVHLPPARATNQHTECTRSSSTLCRQKYAQHLIAARSPERHAAGRKPNAAIEHSSRPALLAIAFYAARSRDTSPPANLSAANGSAAAAVTCLLIGIMGIAAGLPLPLATATANPFQNPTPSRP